MVFIRLWNPSKSTSRKILICFDANMTCFDINKSREHVLFIIIHFQFFYRSSKIHKIVISLQVTNLYVATANLLMCKKVLEILLTLSSTVPILH